jgi:flagella basal body P-ring formation protein FlgA
MTFALFCRASANNRARDLPKDSDLRVYLPREITVENNLLSLGQVSIIRGGESLVAKAGKIPLGRISVPGQKIVIDRPMVLSRLASNGIPASKVTFSGAEKITVRQQLRTVSSGEFVSLASSFLKTNPPGASVCQWNPIRKPKDFVVPETSKDTNFSLRLVRSSVRNRARVEITVLSGGKKIEVREVIFGLKYNSRQAITKVDIAAGGLISSENVKIETKQSDYPEPADWKSPYGLIAKHRLPANTVLRRHMAGPLKPPIVVKRNQNVVIRIERPGFLITAMGQTMQDGKVGEYIKVRNVDSQRIILVRINEDASVEPVL